LSALRVKWFAPLDRLFGPESEIDLDGSISVAEFLTRMCAEEPGLERHVHFNPEDTRPRGIVVLRGPTTLTLADAVGPGDRIDVLVGIQGG